MAKPNTQSVAGIEEISREVPIFEVRKCKGSAAP